MSYYIESEQLIAEFLRSKLTDPRGRITLDQNYTQTLTGSSRVINITGSDNISHIDDVRLDGTLLTKYKDWVYDYNNTNLILITALTGELTYDVYVGTNWIYHDRPRDDMKPIEFPRVCVLPISSPGEVLGNDKAKIVTNFRYQINTYSKKSLPVEVDIGENQTQIMSDQVLSNKINKDIYKVFDNFRDDLHPIFANYDLQVKKAVEPYDSTLQAYNTRQEFIILQIKEEF